MKKHSVRIIGTPDYYSCAGEFVNRNKNNLVTLVFGTHEEIQTYKTEQPQEILQKTLVLVKRELWGEPHWLAEPILKPKGKPIGPMMGGCFITSSDSRWKNFTPYKLGYPIPVHDRFETQEMYDMMSR